MKPTPLSVLRSVRDRLQTHGWTQRAWARNVHGAPVDETAPDACCWCLGGAIALETHSDAREGAVAAIEAELRDERGWGPAIVTWNDAFGRTEEDVFDVLDRAICHLTQQEA